MMPDISSGFSRNVYQFAVRRCDTLPMHGLKIPLPVRLSATIFAVNWKSAVEFLHHWQWLVGGTIAAAPAVYYGPRKALETWDWYVHRFRDEPILQLMRDCKLVPAERNITLEPQIGPNHTPATPNTLILKEGTYSVGDLAHITKRSRISIGKSLRRLRAAGKVELHRGGFRLKQS